MQQKVQLNYKVIDLFELKKFVFVQIKITLKVMIFFGAAPILTSGLYFPQPVETEAFSEAIETPPI